MKYTLAKRTWNFDFIKACEILTTFYAHLYYTAHDEGVGGAINLET